MAQRRDISGDDPVYVFFLLGFCLALMFVGMALA